MTTDDTASRGAVGSTTAIDVEQAVEARRDAVTCARRVKSNAGLA